MTERMVLLAVALLVTPIVLAADGDAVEIRVSAFGAIGDGVTDDSAAIRSALKAAPEGSTVLFDADRIYLVHRLLRVERKGLKLRGYGATVKFIVDEEEVRGKVGEAQTSIQLVAPDTGIYGLIITSNLDRRLAGHQNLCAIVLASERQEARDNRIEYVQTGIFARNAKDFLIADNVVRRTFADGIHVTTGSWGGRITGNVVRETGDDMIAVVNYGAGEPDVGNVLVDNNDVSGQYWGRGITVVGGRDITIRENHISDTTHGAAILIASEAYFNTANVVNVLVDGNEISLVQMSEPRYNPKGVWERTGQGAIHVQAHDKRTIRDVLILRNTVVGSWKYGISLHGDVCQTGLKDNRLDQIGQEAIQIDVATANGCSVVCEGNTSEGREVRPPNCHGVLPDPTGAHLGELGR